MFGKCRRNYFCVNTEQLRSFEGIPLLLDKEKRHET